MLSIWVDLFVFAVCASPVLFLLAKRLRRQPAEANVAERATDGQTGRPQLRQFSSIDPTARGPAVAFERWFGRQVLLTRIPFATALVALGMITIAGSVAVTVLLATDSPLVSGTLAFAALLTLLLILCGVAQWRVMQFRRQLPLALDILGGAVQSGDSIPQAIGLLAGTMQEPARTEFVRCRNQLEMGLSLPATMGALATRIGSLDTRMFATTLSVHRQTGGDLTSTLQRMATVIRSRFEYERHLRAASGMGRLSVFVVIALAWIIFGYIAVMQPEYGRSLWEDPMGRKMLWTALLLEILGVIAAIGLMRAKY